VKQTGVHTRTSCVKDKVAATPGRRRIAGSTAVYGSQVVDADEALLLIFLGHLSAGWGGPLTAGMGTLSITLRAAGQRDVLEYMATSPRELGSTDTKWCVDLIMV
jgi:hypothetical protein